MYMSSRFNFSQRRCLLLNMDRGEFAIIRPLDLIQEGICSVYVGRRYAPLRPRGCNLRAQHEVVVDHGLTSPEYFPFWEAANRPAIS